MTTAGSGSGQSRSVQTPANPISTFVFLDFESTGLLGVGQRPRITELCMVAVQREELLGNKRYPRVTNKLQLCFNPQKPIDIIASNITGLYNDDLENQSVFSSETVLLISSFIRHLSSPVCLVAHNGYGFDFPLLKAELKRINQSLNEELLCADSLLAFKALDGVDHTSMPRFIAGQQNAGRTPVVNTTVDGRQYSTPENMTTSFRPENLKRKLPAGQGDAVTIVKGPKFEGSDSVRIDEAEKVKKRLSFEDSKENKVTHSGATDDLGSSTGKLDKVKDVQATSVETKGPKSTEVGNATWANMEFSASLGDEELLEAAMEAEQTHQTETVAKTTISVAKETTDHVPLEVENTKNSTGSVALLGTVGCYVTSGSGYHVCTVSTSPMSLINNSECLHHTKLSENLASDTSISTRLDAVSPDKVTVSPTKGSASAETVAMSSVVVSSKCPSPPRQTGIRERTPTTATPGASNSKADVTVTGVTSPVPGTSQLGDRQGTAQQGSVTPTKKVSYKLEEIYRRAFGRGPDLAHEAEGDCITLVKIVMKTKSFVTWLDRNALKFSDVQPGY